MGGLSLHGSLTLGLGPRYSGGAPVTPAADPDAPVLSNLASGWTAGDNPPDWNTAYDGIYYNGDVGDPGYGEGDQLRIRWTLGAGAEVIEDWVPYSLDLVTNGFQGSYAFYTNGSLDAGGVFTAYVDAVRDLGLPTESNIVASNAWTDTLDAVGAGAPTFNTIVIEGDSQSRNVAHPEEAGSDTLGFFTTLWKATASGKTVHIRATNSRDTGPIAQLDDNSNTLVGNVAEDAAYNPDLITYMIGSNDLISSTAAQYRTRLTDLYNARKAAQPGVKVGYSPPPPYNPTGTPHPNKTDFDTNRAALMPTVRDPAVWGVWADYYIPIGEHPDFSDAAIAAPLFGDSVHGSAAGHALWADVFAAAMDTLIDPTRQNSNTLYDAAWLASETDLTPGQRITRRMIVSGLKWTGHDGGISITGDGSPSVKVGGVAGPADWAYNGDVIDIELDVSASAETNATITLTIGGDTRQRTFRSAAAVTPVAATPVHLDDVIAGSTVHDQTVNFPSAGRYLIFAIASGAAQAANSLVYDPATANLGATKITHSIGAFANSANAFILDVPSAGSKILRTTFAAFVSQSILSVLLIENASTTLVGFSPNPAGTAPSNEGDPHETAALTVPANGLFIGALAGGEALTVDPPTDPSPHTGTNPIHEGMFDNAGQTHRGAIIVGSRGAGSNVKLGFNYKFGNFGRVGVVFTAAE